MKAHSKILLFFFGSLSLCPSLPAFTEIADGALKFFTDADVTYDSNFEGNAYGADDTIYSFAPGVKWNRATGRIKLNAMAELRFLRHDINDQYDGEYFNTSFNINAPFAAGSPMSGSLSLQYNENTRIDDSLNERVSFTTAEAEFRGAYRFRPAISADLSAAYIQNSTQYYSDTEEKSLTLGATWHDIWQNVALSLDYRYRDISSNGSSAEETSNGKGSFGVSLEGQLLPENLFPKLEASLSFRLQNSTSLRKDEKNQQILGFTGSLKWPARETTSLALTVNRDFDLAPDDRTNEIMSYRFSVNQRVGRKVNLDLGVSLIDSKTLSINRSSTRFTTDLSAYYAINQYLQLTASTVWSELYSSSPMGDYSKYTFQLGAKFTY